jgi:hypothetical protein
VNGLERIREILVFSLMDTDFIIGEVTSDVNDIAIAATRVFSKSIGSWDIAEELGFTQMRPVISSSGMRRHNFRQVASLRSPMTWATTCLATAYSKPNPAFL